MAARILVLVILAGVFWAAPAAAESFPDARRLAASPAKASRSDPSPRGAFLRSLLVPGWGQLAVGTPKRAAVFAIIEGALWMGTAGFYTMRGIYGDDYRACAASVAGANVEGKGSQYFNDLAFYDTRAQHNQTAAVYDESDPELYGVEDDWQWPSTSDRQRYRSRLNDWKTMKQRMAYAVGLIALNHLASAIDAGKTTARRQSPTAVSLVAAPLKGGGQVVLTLGLGE